MTECVPFNLIMVMNDREIEARRALFEYDTSRIKRLAVRLYLAYMNKHSVGSFLDLTPDEQERWREVARVSVNSIKDGTV